MSVWEREMAMAHARAVVSESKGIHPPHPARTLSAGNIQVPPSLHSSSFAPVASSTSQISDGFHKAVRVASRPQRKRYSGHVGDLSKPQEQALAQLRALITDELFRLAGKSNQDDYALLRFLRARDFDVYKAFMMFQNYALWRSQNNIDRVLDTKPPKLELIRKLLPHSHHGFDREGRPVLYEKTGQVDPGILLAMVNPQEYLQCHIYDQELLLRRCEEGGRRVGKVVETYVWVMDLTGVNISHRKGQALLQICSQHDKEYFPERLGRLVIINPPWIFPAMYKLAAPMLDAKTKKKVTVIYGDASETLRSLIAPDQLPAEYGGECKCPRKPGQLDSVWGCIPEYDLSKLREFQAELERRNRLPPEMQERLDRDEKGETFSQTSDEITIAAGAVYEMTFHIQTALGSVAWCWSCAANDINFTVEYTAPRDPVSQSPITVPSTGGSSSSSSQLQQFAAPLSSGFPLSPASGALSPTSSPSPPTSPHMNRQPMPLRASSSTHSSPSASPSPSRSPLPFTRAGSHFSPVLSSGPAQRRRPVEKKTALKVLRTDKHEGSFVSETGATTVKLIWDNTFSYFKSKTIRYRAAVIEDDPAARERLAREADLAALAELQRDIEKLKLESLQQGSMGSSSSSSITDLPTLSRSSSGTVSRSSSGSLSSSSVASLSSGTLSAMGPSTALYTPPVPSPKAVAATRTDLPPLPSPTSALALPSAKPKTKGASSRSRNSSLSTLTVPAAANPVATGPTPSMLINQNAWLPIGRERVLNHEEFDLDFSSLADHHEFVGKVFHSIL